MFHLLIHTHARGYEAYCTSYGGLLANVVRNPWGEQRMYAWTGESWLQRVLV